MALEPSAEIENMPVEAFSSVWVKVEVEEEGTVEGIDEAEETEDNDQEENYQETENSQEAEEVQVLPRRSRRKPAAPRKAKNVEERIFQCEYCDYKAIHKSTLKYHLMKHTNPDPIPCNMCSYTTTHPASLRRHMLSVHTDQNDPIIQALPDKKCTQCDFTCKLSWKLFVHKRKHVKKSFQCEQCDFSTARKSNFEKHCKTHKHNDGVTYECDKCPFVTKHEGHISRHLAVIHKEVCASAKKCDYCEFSTKIRWRLNIHKKNSHQEKPIKCDFCEFVTEYNCEYKLHKHQHISEMALVASGLKLPSADQQSSVTYKPPKGKGNMADSSMDGSNDKDFIVDTTCEEIDWRSIEVGENPGQEKPFHCILCLYKSKFKASVQRHFQRNHTSENSKPYKCVNCDFSTKTRDQISLHSKRSKSAYQISCKECDFTTFYKCQMAEHQRSHWRFKCKICDFVCRVSYDLNTHYTVVHLGQGLKCRFCNFEAARKGSLLNHENTHTNKRFRCGLCDYSATRRNLLFNHMKRCHAGEKPKIIISDRKFELLKKVEQKLCDIVESNNGDDLKNIESCDKFESDKKESIKYENAKEQFRNDEQVQSEFESQLKVKCDENESQSKLTETYAPRQSEYEEKNIEFQNSHMFGDASMRDIPPGNAYEIESRDSMFYSL